MYKINNHKFKYPTLCISVIDNYLVFTTKKNASRYFEDLSRDSINESKVNTINFYLHNLEDVIDSFNNDTMYKFSNYVFEVTPNTPLDQFNFFNLIGVDSIEEIFLDKTFEKFKFIFIIRNPIDRFFTGFFEKVDSIIGEIKSDNFNIFTFDILKKYFNINSYSSLNTLSQDKINFILNTFASSVNDKIFNDEHISFWNYFLLNFLKKQNLEGRVIILDLNNIFKIESFKQIKQPSNKPCLSKWLYDESNKNNIDSLLFKFKKYLDIEVESYNFLIEKYKSGHIA
jgi:hypothetical protein